ncbi:hypothetical protein BYT27DRAFT_7181475 [Phlegmacium glaucopus]|nr:hypothetical protein BYT27DRAFT_7181475 [Phlegmacium glaucopus]
MQLSHIPLPSFTLVLTSGHRSLYGDPIPAVLDHLMKTIDFRYVPNDDKTTRFEDHESSSNCIGENVDTQTILDSERPVTESHGGEKRAGNISFKSLALFIVVLKRRFTRK